MKRFIIITLFLAGANGISYLLFGHPETCATTFISEEFGVVMALTCPWK